MRHFIDGDGTFFLNTEAEFSGKANGSQHPDRIFPVAYLGVADDSDHAPLYVFQAIGIVIDAIILRVVIEGVHGEITTTGIFVDRAEEVVSQQQTLGGSV